MTKEIGDEAAVSFSEAFMMRSLWKKYHQAFEFEGMHRLENLRKSAGRLMACKASTGRAAVASVVPEHLKPVFYTHPNVFIHCHSEDEERVEKELLQPLERAGRRIAGDWIYRNDPPASEAYNLSLN